MSYDDDDDDNNDDNDDEYKQTMLTELFCLDYSIPLVQYTCMHTYVYT